jgi:transcription initiation factor TFIIIB Brf1 subunit/transcription initiation factor TFIIB
MILGGYGGTRAMWRVRKYHSWNTIPYKERVYIQTCERLSLIGLNAGINQATMEDTKHLYVSLQDLGGRQGLSRDALLSACLYVSLKQSGSPRKPKDVADLFGISSPIFTKALKQMQEIMALARQKGMLTTVRHSEASTQAAEYIQLPLSRLPIPRAHMERLMLECQKIATRAEEIGLAQENMPPSLAAACIAFVLKKQDGVELPHAKIAGACEISVATLQKCLRRLEMFEARITA